MKNRHMECLGKSMRQYHRAHAWRLSAEGL